MRAFLVLNATGLVLSSAWIAVAHAINVGAFSRGWWAGFICATLGMLAARRLTP